jgi:tRNA(Leu) C34 or U34 (ribose-2'-O)-methylase TrmL
MSFNIALLHPKNRENLATILRSGQNFGVNTVFVIGGFVESKYKGNIHKFSHQMDTQAGTTSLSLLYFKTLKEFLAHLPAQTTLVLVETYDYATELQNYTHPLNATYLFGRETTGIGSNDLSVIESFFTKLHTDIPKKYVKNHSKTAHFDKVRINTPNSLNIGVCSSIIMYDRQSKLSQKQD